MTNTPQPAFGSSPRRGDSLSWWWQLRDSAGVVVEPQTRHEFPTRSDAESWLGEAYPELQDEGVASVTLFEGDREVYGPMSLAAG